MAEPLVSLEGWVAVCSVFEGGVEGLDSMCACMCAWCDAGPSFMQGVRPAQSCLIVCVFEGFFLQGAWLPGDACGCYAPWAAPFEASLGVSVRVAHRLTGLV